nr:MAG TPA: Nine Cysteines Domain of family 3 GPCR [Bacteriophage sp.]
MKKAELIELLHLAERNYETLKFAYGNAVDNSKCNRCPIMQTRGGEAEDGD